MDSPGQDGWTTLAPDDPVAIAAQALMLARLALEVLLQQIEVEIDIEVQRTRTRQARELQRQLDPLVVALTTLLRRKAAEFGVTFKFDVDAVVAKMRAELAQYAETLERYEKMLEIMGTDQIPSA